MSEWEGGRGMEVCGRGKDELQEEERVRGKKTRELVE